MRSSVINQMFLRHSRSVLHGRLASFIVGATVAASIAQANEVTLPYKGLTLNARLELAASRKIADGVILITHGGLAHRDMEIIAKLQELFKARGYNTLAINLSLGLNNRHGMYDCKVTHRHANDDAAKEIGAWVNWLKNQGVKRVSLLGHSRGGAQTALYAAESDTALVKAVVLLAPATQDNTDATAYLQNFNKPLAPQLEKAQKLVDTGKGSSVLKGIGLLNCANTSATAGSFVSYYAHSPRLDAPSLISRIKWPTLVVVAGNDEVVTGLDKKLAPLNDKPHIQMTVVAGADHTFRDLYAEDAVDAIDTFLKSTGYASPSSYK